MKDDDRKLEPTLFSICTDRIGKLGKNLFSLEQSFRERDQELQDVLERVKYLEEHGVMPAIPPSKEEEEDEVHVADDEIVHDVVESVLSHTRKELDLTKKKLEEAESTIALLQSNNASLDSIITQLDKDKHLDAILEDRERAWTQDYQPRIKGLRQVNLRLEQDNIDLYQENLRLEQENKDLERTQQVLENLRHAYERLQQAHTDQFVKLQADRGEES